MTQLPQIDDPVIIEMHVFTLDVPTPRGSIIGDFEWVGDKGIDGSTLTAYGELVTNNYKTRNEGWLFVNLQNASHSIRKVELRDNKEVWATIELLKSAQGDFVRKWLQEGKSIRLGQRGTGRYNGAKEYPVMREFKMFTVDILIEPDNV